MVRNANADRLLCTRDSAPRRGDAVVVHACIMRAACAFVPPPAAAPLAELFVLFMIDRGGVHLATSQTLYILPRHVCSCYAYKSSTYLEVGEIVHELEQVDRDPGRHARSAVG